MKIALKLGLVSLLTPLLTSALFAQQQAAQRPWQEITVPSVSEAAANFKSPPHEYCDQSFRKLERAGRQ